MIIFFLRYQWPRDVRTKFGLLVICVIPGIFFFVRAALAPREEDVTWFVGAAVSCCYGLALLIAWVVFAFCTSLFKCSGSLFMKD